MAGSYTITITPDNETDPSATLRVNLGAAGAHVTEMTVRAGRGDGFLPDELPGFDLSRLMRAITPATTAAPVIEAPSTPHVVPAPVAAEAPAAPRGRGGARAAAGRKATTRPARKAAAGVAAAEAPTAQPTKAGRGAAKATTKAGGRRAGAKSAKAGTGSRAYRRMPDDIVEVFHQAGGVTAVAKHYNVPRYTAQSWVRRLRQEGKLPATER